MYKSQMKKAGCIIFSFWSLLLHLVNFTFPADLHLGRCVKSAFEASPSGELLQCLLISFPRSTLCQIYSSDAELYQYTYQFFLKIKTLLFIMQKKQSRIQ